MIFPYYVTIGGWVLKYLLVYITGNGHAAAQDGYFSGFIGQTAEPIIMMLVFTIIVAFIIFRGVNSGIESSSKIIRPLLIVLVLGVSCLLYTSHSIVRHYLHYQSATDNISYHMFLHQDQ